jgi:phosphate transport system substrate-binding protein
MQTTTKLISAAVAAIVVIIVAAGCGGSGKRSTGNVAGAGKTTSSIGGTLTGAGSTLIQPAIQAVWGPGYNGATVNYSGVGSGTGIQSISSRTVDFGASDAPMTPDQFAACHGCVRIPWALTATTAVVNIPNVRSGQLHLTGPVLAKIYLGQITKWNDPAIEKLNAGLNLPDLEITVVHRSDGSGDTYAFTNYLSKVSKQWSSQVGNATTVSWPVGVGGKGNPGIAAIMNSQPGSIGYVSVAYVLQNHLTLAGLKNASGQYTLPTIHSIESAAQLVNGKRLPKDNAISITDAPKTKTKTSADAYPLATFTYVIVPKNSSQTAALKAFISFALTSKEQKAIRKLVFAPMPQVVVQRDKSTLAGL